MCMRILKIVRTFGRNYTEKILKTLINILALSLLLSACASQPPVVDRELASHFQVWERQNAKSTAQVGARFAVLPAKTLAWCNMETKQISVNSYYWEFLGQTERQDLIDHELKHCVLGWKHGNEPSVRMQMLKVGE